MLLGHRDPATLWSIGCSIWLPGERITALDMCRDKGNGACYTFNLLVMGLGMGWGGASLLFQVVVKIGERKTEIWDGEKCARRVGICQ